MRRVTDQNSGEFELRRALEEVEHTVQQARQDAARAGAPVPAPSGVDPNFAVDVLRGEIAATRDLVTQISQQLGNPGLDRRQVDALNGQMSAATSRLTELQNRLDRYLGRSQEQTTAVPRAPDPIEEKAMELGREATLWFFTTVAVVAIGVPLARAFGRWLDRRGSAPKASPDATARMERMEQAIEAVAIEVERVSEGQRYTNKLMQEMRGLPAPDPAAAWVPAPARQPVPVRVDESR
jgi:hypothetical protein